MKHLCLLIPFVAVAALIVGCQQGPQNATLTEMTRRPVVSPAETPEATASPPNEYRRKLTQEAMRGLVYESGRVEIDYAAAKRVAGLYDGETARAAYERGRALLQRNAVMEALKAHTKAVLLAPGAAEFYEGLGHALLAKRKDREAAAAFRTALDLAPMSVSARFSYADALNRIGELEQAIAELQTVVEQDPQHAKAHSRLAILLYYAGRSDEAWGHVHQAEALGYQVPPQFRALLAGDVAPRTPGRGDPPLVGEQVRADQDNTGPGNETSCASSDFDPQQVVATWNDYREGKWRMGVALSLDGGSTWEDFLIRPPSGYQAYTEGDPMTAYDNRTGTLWVGAISFAGNGGVFVARKAHDEDDFQPAVMAKATGSADKGWMAAGVDSDNPDLTRLYIAYNQGLLVSTDMGETWSGPTSLGYGLGFLPRVGPKGEIYVAYWDWSDGVMLKRSYDGGETFTAHMIATRMDVWGIDGTRFPGQFRVPPLNYLAVDPNDGTLYSVYFDTTDIWGGNRNVDLYFNKSTDQGTTWTTPVVINGDAEPPGDQFFPWIEVDEAGRLHLLFYDTRAVVQNDNQSPAWIEAYYAYSDDCGDTWSEIVLTPEPFSSAYDGFGDFFIGDYLGMGFGRNRAYPCYMSTQNLRADIFVHAIISILRGDLNCDSAVDFDDINPFVLVLTDPDAWQQAFPDCPIQNGDINGDGEVDFNDINPFVALLSGQ